VGTIDEFFRDLECHTGPDYKLFWGALTSSYTIGEVSIFCALQFHYNLDLFTRRLTLAKVTCEFSIHKKEHAETQYETCLKDFLEAGYGSQRLFFSRCALF